ncbi:MAG: hypothetical protein ACRETJ_12175 [Steroidobacteraceae bacterium]
MRISSQCIALLLMLLPMCGFAAAVSAGAAGRHFSGLSQITPRNVSGEWFSVLNTSGFNTTFPSYRFTARWTWDGRARLRQLRQR